MGTIPDPSKMAQEFLKIWQQQITKTMTDPNTVEATLATMQQFYGAGHDAPARRPAPAPDARDDAIAKLSQRIRKLEQSVSALTTRLDAAQKSAGTKRRSVAKTVAERKRTTKRPGKPVAKSTTPKPKRKTK